MARQPLNLSLDLTPATSSTFIYSHLPAKAAHMIKSVHHCIKSLDRLLPSILFAFLLSLQTLISTGAANGIAFPELIGPDGRVLTFADLCNAAGEDKTAQKHCASCVASHLNLPNQAFTAALTLQASSHFQPSKYADIILRPEATQAKRRAPPYA